MKIYSGDCLLAECGIETKLKDVTGKTCHTGDIVVLWHGEHCRGLTAIVDDKFTSYSDGSIEVTGDGNPFVMGIKSVDLNNQKDWRIEIVKKFSDVIDGERWSNYGFNYRDSK